MSADLIFSALFLTGSNVIDRARGASESSKLPRTCPVLAPSENRLATQQKIRLHCRARKPRRPWERTSCFSAKRTTTTAMIDDVRPDPDDFPAGTTAEADAAAARRGRVKLFAADRSVVTGVPRDRSRWRRATGRAWLHLFAHSALATLAATLTGWLLSHSLHALPAVWRSPFPPAFFRCRSRSSAFSTACGRASGSCPRSWPSPPSCCRQALS